MILIVEEVLSDWMLKQRRGYKGPGKWRLTWGTISSGWAHKGWINRGQEKRKKKLRDCTYISSAGFGSVTDRLWVMRDYRETFPAKYYDIVCCPILNTRWLASSFSLSSDTCPFICTSEPSCLKSKSALLRDSQIGSPYSCFSQLCAETAFCVISSESLIQKL